MRRLPARCSGTAAPTGSDAGTGGAAAAGDARKGYPEVGQVDGRYGDKTRKAILAFRTITADARRQAERDPGAGAGRVAKAQPEARADATPAEVREKVPEVKATGSPRWGCLGLGCVRTATGVTTIVTRNIRGARRRSAAGDGTAGGYPLCGAMSGCLGVACSSSLVGS